MSTLVNIISKFFGSKSDRDIKAIMPVVEQIREEYDKLQELSNDQLREKSAELKKIVQDYIANEEKTITELKKKAEDPAIDMADKEALFGEIDKTEKTINERIETALNKVLPQAFAIVKETARRFKELEYLEVEATDFDKELAAARNSIEIHGKKA